MFENILFLLIFGQFLGFGGRGVCLVVHGFSETFALVFCWYFIHQSLLLPFNGNLVFVAFPAVFRKIEEMVHFQIVYKKRFWFLKKLHISQKRKMIRYVSSGSAPPLLRNLSSQFAAILVYAQFLSLPLCDVIYIWSVIVNIILKIRNSISVLAVFQITEFPILKKKRFSTCTYIIRILFPEGSTKNIKSSILVIS